VNCDARRIEPVLADHGRQRPGRSCRGGFGDQPGPGHGDLERLFHDQVSPGRPHLNRDVGVPATGDGDGDGVHVVAAEQVGE